MPHNEAPDRQATAITAACIILTALWLLVMWLASRKKQKMSANARMLRLPPGPRGWPIVGALPYVNGKLHESLEKLSRKFGPLMFVHLGSTPTVVVSNAAIAKEMLKTNDVSTAGRPLFIVGSILLYDYTDVGFAPYGDSWRRARRLCFSRLFSASRVKHFQSKRKQQVHETMKCIWKKSQDGGILDMNTLIEDMTMNIITQMMWNKSHRGAIEDHDFAKLVDDTNDVVAPTVGDLIPSLSWLSSAMGQRRRLLAVHKRWDDFLERLLFEHKQKAAYTGGKMETSSEAADFLDMMLELTKLPEDDADHLDEISVKAILVDMITAGTETVAITLQWALSHLLKKPHMMKIAQDEVTAAVGTERMVTEEEASNLPYLDAVIRESLRLNPPASLSLPHLTIADFQVNEFDVPAGSLLFINLWAIQRDPHSWKEPGEFRPERFLGDGAVDWKGQNFEFIPFGSGRRQCPGMNHATHVLHLALAQALHLFDWSLPGNQTPEDLDMEQGFSFTARRAVPLKVLAKPRLSNDMKLQ